MCEVCFVWRKFKQWENFNTKQLEIKNAVKLSVTWHNYDNSVPWNNKLQTSNVTGRHRGPKRKLQAGYRSLSLQCTSHFSSLSVVSRAFSALCLYTTFRHHPHPLGYLCATFRFFHGFHCWASSWRKITYSINHSVTPHAAYLTPQEPKLSLRNIVLHWVTVTT